MFSVVLFLDTYRAQRVRKDGNCFYSSVALQTGRRAAQHLEVRKELVDVVRRFGSQWVSSQARVVRIKYWSFNNNNTI